MTFPPDLLPRNPLVVASCLPLVVTIFSNPLPLVTHGDAISRFQMYLDTLRFHKYMVPLVVASHPCILLYSTMPPKKKNLKNTEKNGTNCIILIVLVVQGSSHNM